MKRTAWSTLAFMLGTACTTAHGASDKPSGLAGLAPVELHDGINAVTGFAPDGRSGTIIRTWRENGNAWGYHLFIVTTAQRGGGSWNVVGIDDPMNKSVLRDHLTDAPHTGEDAITSIRFAHGRLNGEAATLLLEVRRDLGSAPVPDPAVATLYIYQMTTATPEESVGSTPDYFRLVGQVRSRTKFCSSDMALSKLAGLPLPKDYAGSAKADGC